MKKLISTILAAIMLTAWVPVSADTAESEAMAEALVRVKAKVDIPEELTEFKNNSYISGESKTYYSFEWTDKDESETIYVKCNDKGEVLNYNRFIADEKYDYSQRLPGFSSEQALKAAEEFLSETAPETKISENDYYVYERRSASSQGYTFEFARYHDGIKMLGSTADVSVVMVDGEIQATSMNISFPYRTGYDVEIEPSGEEITDPVTQYKQAFPIELIYTDKYRKVRAGEEADQNEICMVYRINNDEPGYISAYTGETVKFSGTDYIMPLYSASLSEKGSVANESALMDTGLSVSEIAEIEAVSSLVSKEACIKNLANAPVIKMSDTLKEDSSSLWVTDKDNGEYTREITLRETGGDERTKRLMRVQFDAVRGIITELYSSDGGLEDVPVVGTSQRRDEAINGFLSYALGDALSEFKLIDKDETGNIHRYVRMVDGIPYIDDWVYIYYNSQKDIIKNYTLNYNRHAEFPQVGSAVSAETAYTAVLNDRPIEKVYVCDGEKYVLAYGLTNTTVIDAVTGMPVEENNDYNVEGIVYSDISGHWCENAVNKLQEYDIAFNYSELRPDEAASQIEVLRLFLSGVNGKWAMKSDTESIYSRCYSMDIIDKSQRSDTAAVTREQAFKYMVSLMGYDKVAKLPEIYKVKYADGDMMSDGMVGYAAILSGMGIINGDGATIRPKDYLTRAEALAMVYNYLTSPLR